MPVKNKYYKKIQGWFNFELPYERLVNELPDGSTIVEVGSWRGASTCYLGTYIKENSREIKVIAVDTWAGSQETIHKQIIGTMGGPDKLYNDFLTNLRLAEIDKIVTPLRLPSVQAAKTFADKSVAAVYVDAGHTYGEVKEDILSWLPKATYVIAGHDYHPDSMEVVNAVHDTIGKDKLIIFEDNRTWWLYL